MAVWLMQYPCPSRHAIVGLLYEQPGAVPADLETSALQALADKGANPWCALCKSRDLRFEHQALPGVSWDVAARTFARLGLAQTLTRLGLDQRVN